MLQGVLIKARNFVKKFKKKSVLVEVGGQVYKLGPKLVDRIYKNYKNDPEVSKQYGHSDVFHGKLITWLRKGNDTTNDAVKDAFELIFNTKESDNVLHPDGGVSTQFDSFREFKKEMGVTFVGDVMSEISIGTFGSNPSDFFGIKEIWKKDKSQIITMIHTHPTGCPLASEKDINMLTGWSIAFPVNIWFGVKEYNNARINWYIGNNGKVIYLGYERGDESANHDLYSLLNATSSRDYKTEEDVNKMFKLFSNLSTKLRRDIYTM